MKKRIESDFHIYYEIIIKIGGYEEFNPIYEAKEIEANEKITIKIFNKKLHNKKFNLDKKETTFLEIYENMKKISSINEGNEDSIKIYEYFENEKEFVIVMD